MARARYYEAAQLTDGSGFVKKVANPEVTVYEAGTTTPLADTLYAADTGDDTALSNPFTAASDGSVEFYLETPKRVSVKLDGASVGLGTATKVMDPGNLNTGLYSSDGSKVATLSDAGVFSAPGLLRLFGVYAVTDHGVVMDSAAAKTTNAAALSALAATAADSGAGGRIYVPKGTLHTEAFSMNHGLGIGVPLTLEGSGWSSILKLHGTDGPLIDVAGDSSSQIARGGIRDIRITHNDAVASGATIRLGNVQTFFLDAIQMLYDTAENAAMICVQVGNGTLNANDLLVKDSIFWTSDNAGTQIGFDFATGGAACGNYRILNTRIKGNNTDSIAVRFNNSTIIDTVYFDAACVFEQHNVGIAKHTGAGAVSNLFCRGTVFDQITLYGVRLEASAICQSWTFDGCWVRVENLTFLIGHGGAAPRDIAILNCPTITNDVGTAIYVEPGVGDIRIQNNTITCLDGTNAYDGVLIGDGVTAAGNIMVNGTRVTVGSTATSSVKIGAAITSANVSGNHYRGKNDVFGPTPSAALIHENNSFLA